MHSLFNQPGRAWLPAPRPDEQELYTRVRVEFRELPGLTLTVRQAARLFSTEPSRCERVLDALVSAGVLDTDGSVFGRPGAGAGLRSGLSGE